VVRGSWAAHAVDDDVRFRGSSGGVLTALAEWCLANGVAHAVIGAGPDVSDPRRTVPVTITSRPDALAAAGSRYAPVAVGSHSEAVDPSTAVVAKPCEVAALRSLAALTEAEPPLLLSFFCAGTPSQQTTDLLAERLGGSGRRVRELWYRGRGWPGSFTVRTDDGARSMSYEDSWGGHLGRTVQWRCRVCVDGVGEFADLVAGDLWHVDDKGFPLFLGADGTSALVARTERGLDVVRRATRDGALSLTEVSADDIMAVQPLQRTRRTTLLGRLVGTMAGGRRVPVYRGFGLGRLALRDLRATVGAARYTRSRLRADGEDPGTRSGRTAEPA
jgi:coenzyme F420 hydrogenase subunit beta